MGKKLGAPVQVEPVSLEYAKQAAFALEEAKEDLRDAMILAREAGNSYNQIALAVGFSHKWVIKIVEGEGFSTERPGSSSRPGGAW